MHQSHFDSESLYTRETAKRCSYKGVSLDNYLRRLHPHRGYFHLFDLLRVPPKTAVPARLFHRDLAIRPQHTTAVAVDRDLLLDLATFQIRRTCAKHRRLGVRL